ncbi:aspartic peptidase domain-containing protein [Biscogniauxia mediterranea]|nr:aspartic peptidase domain-containing protein [Biscogniauxia mediterranea]
MHRGLIFLQLSSWFASIHALVPYAPPGGYGGNVGRSAAGANSGAPGGFVTFKLVQNGPDRDNDYTVLNAVEPTVSNSAGIDQDGTDYSYFVEAKLGSDGKPLYMLLDTGASTTWVMGSGCTSAACKSHNSFGPSDSKTYVDTGKTYAVEYGTGSVSGHVITDTMSIAGLSAPVSFGVANTTSDEFSAFPFDGILGLSMSPDTWLTAIKNANLIDANVFGISLARAADGTNDGEIAFGAPNPEKMEGNITYTPLKAGSTWTITMDGATVDGKSAGLDGKDAYIDTGTSFIFGPPNDVKAIYGMIPDSAQQDSATWSVPCDSDVPVALTFSGKSWTISSKDFVSGPNDDGVCTGKIYGMEYVKGAWLVGDTFLKNVYSVYDMDQRRIGFAAKAPYSNSTQDSSNSTTTSPTATAGTSTSTGSSTASGTGLNGHETTTADSSSSGEMLVAGSQLAFARCYHGNTMGNAKTQSSHREHKTNDGDLHSTAAAPKNEEEHGLLAGNVSDEDEDEDEDEDGLIVHPGDSSDHPRTPRTPNRVRFDLRPTNIPSAANGDHLPQDYFDLDEPDSPDDHGSESTSRHPLLTDIEAPSVALANQLEEEDIHEWAERERTRPKSGLRSAFMNMANSIIGAGIIGQPYAFKDAGLLAGIVLLVGLTVVVDWTIRLIVINSKLSGANSFQGTVEHCFGRPGLIAISIAQWAFAFGGMVAFGVIVGDSIPAVLRTIWPGLAELPVLGILADRRAVIAIFILGVSYPLTLYRDIAKLAKASTLALISMVIILVTVIVQSALTPKEERGSFTTPLLTINEGIFQAIGVISFAFVCQHNSLLIYGSLKTPTIDRFATVTHYSTGVSMLACLVMALAGFLTFGDRTKGNVLNNFPADNSMVTVARLCFGLNMLTTLPLEAFVCREVMTHYYFPGEPFSLSRHLIFSSALVVSAMTLSLVTCDLGVVFELVGATSASALAYILPPLCYIKLSSRSWKTYVAMGIVVFGWRRARSMHLT